MNAIEVADCNDGIMPVVLLCNERFFYNYPLVFRIVFRKSAVGCSFPAGFSFLFAENQDVTEDADSRT